MIPQTARERVHVTQHELHRVQRYDKSIKELKAEIARLEGERDDLAEDILAMIDQGLPVQAGRLRAVEKICKGRRNPKWRAICEEQLGSAFVNTVLEDTEPSPDRRVLTVQEDA